MTLEEESLSPALGSVYEQYRKQPSGLFRGGFDKRTRRIQALSSALNLGVTGFA